MCEASVGDALRRKQRQKNWEARIAGGKNMEMDKLLLEIYAEHMAKEILKTKKQVDDFLLCKHCQNLPKFCSKIIHSEELKNFSDKTKEMALMKSFFPTSFLNVFLLGGERLQNEIAVEFHYRAVVDNRHKEEKASHFIEQNPLRLFDARFFYSKVEAMLKNLTQ